MHNLLSRSPKRYAVMRCKVLEFLHCTMQGHSLQQVPQQPPQVKHQSPLLRGGLSCTLIWRQEETWRSCGANHNWLWEWLRWELDRSLCCKYEVFFSFFVVAVSMCCECLSYEAKNSHYHTIIYVAFSSFGDFQVSFVRWWCCKQILLKMTLWYSLHCLSTGIQQVAVTC